MRKQMQDCLDAKGGEVSARLRAAELGRAYLHLNPTGRERFLGILAADFGVHREAVIKAAQEYQHAEGGDNFEKECRLRDALIAPRVRLLTQFNDLPEGVKFLVDLRSDLLDNLKSHPEFQPLDWDLKSLLASCVDVGFLELRRISWDSPASLLEKLIAYEAVHEIESWTDLRNRLESDRRCYAFFHPHMPGEPLIFIEVALLDQMAGSIQVLLDTEAPEFNPRGARTAIFYSINNTQKGLRG
ncbi:MAG: malonyl-CoA decarboxylase, partial [Candidatus Eisenbacteria bacterium]|nr:malonyl-CoA decarboxylase [Candidatus Eisenbacteria bacterium]